MRSMTSIGGCIVCRESDEGRRGRGKDECLTFVLSSSSATERTAMYPKRALAISSAALVLVGSLSYRMRRATLRKAVVTRVSGTPAVARISLYYGSGIRPWSVIIDLLTQNGVSGSVTCDGDTTATEVPLSQPFDGAYTLTTTATYRSFGVPKTLVQTHQDTL